MNTLKDAREQALASLAPHVKGFQPANLELLREDYEKLKSSKAKFELFDIWLRILSRIAIGIFFIWLIWYQNRNVFQLVTTAMSTNQLSNLQLIFATLIAGTLTETYLIAQIIVRWVFSDINYKNE